MLRALAVVCFGLVATMTLAACGGSGQVDDNCQVFCEWSYGCMDQAGADQDVSGTPSWGGAGGVEGCISQCVQGNEMLYDIHRSCYDATWDLYAGCMPEITCEELQQEGDVVEERCGQVSDRAEQICEDGMPR